jgi:hypothetical protein
MAVGHPSKKPCIKCGGHKNNFVASHSMHTKCEDHWDGPRSQLWFVQQAQKINEMGAEDAEAARSKMHDLLVDALITLRWDNLAAHVV